ncbi:adhesin [Faucicola mancuniensis]|uniref:ACP-like domain-containing protein n=1 Tax=Faucicola mancuniensis TaxID=1309795 RepID=UPI0028ECB4AE|nr:adhesin [uncultured Moraxella sp.]
MKLQTIALTALTMTALVGTAHAEYSATDAHEADASTVLKREVSYQCQGNKKTKVTYGFNAEKLPTYASIYANGKNRFMPINLDRSDSVDTVFGDENNYSLMTEGSNDFTLSNYHKANVSIQNEASEIIYKDCRVTSLKKLK